MRRRVTFKTGSIMYHLEISYAHPNILSGGSPGRIRKIADQLDQVDKLIESERGLVTVHGKYKGIPVTSFSTGMGPASVSITLPEIIEACDDPNMFILRLGTSGGLQQYLNVGDLVVTDRIKRREDTSTKIMGQNYEAYTNIDSSNLLYDTAKEYLIDQTQKVYRGTTKTVDELYWDQLYADKEDHGDVIAVSMEGSVYCAIRDRYNRDYKDNIKVGEILIISNMVIGTHCEPADMNEFNKRKKQIEEAQIKIGLETLLRARN